MTLSKEDSLKREREDRLEREQRALQLIGQHCDESKYFIGNPLQMEPARSQEILETTWVALVKHGYLKKGLDYELTALGWKKALSAMEKLCDRQMNTRLCVLRNALGRRLQESKARRDTDAVIELHEIVTADLEEYWIFNAIESRLIKDCLKLKDAYWASDPPKAHVIQIPDDFGLPL